MKVFGNCDRVFAETLLVLLARLAVRPNKRKVA